VHQFRSISPASIPRNEPVFKGFAEANQSMIRKSMPSGLDPMGE